MCFEIMLAVAAVASRRHVKMEGFVFLGFVGRFRRSALKELRLSLRMKPRKGKQAP